MRKINLKGISEILSEGDLKNVVGGFGEVMMAPAGKEDPLASGSTAACYSLRPCNNDSDWAGCSGKLCGASCYNSNLKKVGRCAWILGGFNACKTCAVNAL